MCFLFPGTANIFFCINANEATWIQKQCSNFKDITSHFKGLLTPLFWTSGDVYSGF